jgi:hypothetical protein
MINNDNEYSTDTVTTQSKAISPHDNNSTMSPAAPLSNPSDEEQSVQITDNDQNNAFLERESQDNQLAVVQNEEEEEQQQEGEDDEFIRITAAHQMLTEGKQNPKAFF